MSVHQPLGAPSGLVTFLFTDVEGSTRLWEQHPAQMQAALARHDSLMRASIDAHRGYVFSVAGDAFAAAFHTPEDAADAAIEVQQALAREPWPEPVTIRVRMGLHTGVAEERGGDYFGPVLNRAARLMSAGHGGQLLVSAATKELLGARTTVDLGEHRLKDLSAPERIFQLEIDGGDHDFAPLRTLNSIETNLPIRMSSFIGRDADLDTATAEIQTSRLLTITGPGGVGKSSLSFQLAARLSGEVNGGVWIVELAPVQDGGAIPYQFAAALGAVVEAGSSPAATVVNRIGDDPVVLVVDNCEHVRAEAAAMLRELLNACPRLKVIATSREPLGVAGEHVHVLSPLSTADPEGPAVQLLRERLSDANPNLDFDDERDKVLLDICRDLDGLPLAIELAAARARSMTPEDIADRLKTRFKLLKDRRGEVDRHATLQATIDWSYQLLDETEKALYCRLAVFDGDFSSEAAEQVCADLDLDELDVFDALDSLVERSMVVADVGARHAAYSMLISIREHALTQLGDDRTKFLDRHLDYFADLVPRVVDAALGSGEVQAVAMLDHAWDNVRAAVSYAAETGQVQRLKHLIEPLAFDVMFRNRTEVIEWIDRALAAHHRSLDSDALRLVAVEVSCHSARGDASQVMNRGAFFFEHVAQNEAAATGMDCIVVGFALSLAGDNEPSLGLYQLAEQRGRAADDDALLGWALLSQSLTFAYAGDADRSRELSTEARRLLGDDAALTLLVAADLVEALRGDHSPEVTVDRLAVTIERARSVRAELFHSVCVMADAAARARMGDLSVALVEAAETLERHRSEGAYAVVLQQLRRSAVLLMRSEDFETAAAILGFLEVQQTPDINPQTARELDELRPAMEQSLGDRLDAVQADAKTSSLSAVTDRTITGLRSALARD